MLESVRGLLRRAIITPFRARVEQWQASIDAWRARRIEFWESQGFVMPPNDCIPDPPGREDKSLELWRGIKSLTREEHMQVFKESLLIYRASFTQSPKVSKVVADIEEEDLKGKTKEEREKEYSEAMRELKESLDGVGPKSMSISDMKKIATEKMGLYKDTVDAFVEGYKETVDLHEMEKHAASSQTERTTTDPTQKRANHSQSVQSGSLDSTTSMGGAESPSPAAAGLAGEQNFQPRVQDSHEPRDQPR